MLPFMFPFMLPFMLPFVFWANDVIDSASAQARDSPNAFTDFKLIFTPLLAVFPISGRADARKSAALDG
jgi:hypothetical protein